jgi:hypothetical protein
MSDQDPGEPPPEEGKVVPIRGPMKSIDAALGYIRMGWPVLPIRKGTKQPETVLVPQGHLNATLDPALAREWWGRHPDLGVGIALKPAGLVAIDVDPRSGGLDTFDRLEAAHGKIDSDVINQTGGGGFHILYDNSRGLQYPGALGPGVEVKSDGLIAVFPTIHPSGKQYQWEASSDPLEGMRPSMPPAWFYELARVPGSKLGPLPEVPPMPIAPERLADLLSALPTICSDEREVWLKVGTAIHNEIPDSRGFEIWTQWSQASHKFEPIDQMRVWRSFRRRGLDGLGLNTVFKMAYETGWRSPGYVDLQEVGGDTIITLPSPPVTNPVRTLSELERDRATQKWLVKGIFPAVGIVTFFGASGCGKSFIVIDALLRIAHGMDWCGRRIKRQGPVVIIAAEGGASIVDRIAAWHLENGIDPADSEGLVYVLPQAVLLDQENTASQVATWIERKMGPDRSPVAIAVDTQSQTFSGNENDAKDVSGYLRSLGKHLRDRFQACIVTVSHSGHAQTERPRGSSALIANVDGLLGVFRDPKVTAAGSTATVTFVKVKDAETPADVLFTFERLALGIDEDGDEITSLAACFAKHPADAALANKATGDSGHQLGQYAAQILGLLPADGSWISRQDLLDAFKAAHGVKGALENSLRQGFYKGLKQLCQRRMAAEETTDGGIVLVRADLSAGSQKE